MFVFGVDTRVESQDLEANLSKLKDSDNVTFLALILLIAVINQG